MSYRELSMVEVKEVLRLWVSRRSIKHIVRVTGLGRNTVRRYVRTAKNCGLVVGEHERAVDDAFVAEVAARLLPGGSSEVGEGRKACRQHRDKIELWSRSCDAPKIRKLLQRQAVEVKLRTLQRFIREELGPQRDTIRLPDPDPGVLEFDFLELGTFEDENGHVIKVHGALLTAAVSRHQFLWPCLSQKRDDVIAALEAAWEFFGGVFPVLLPDNLKAIVDKSDAIQPRFNDWFYEYAQHRGFEIDPARVRKPRDKARVERQVRYVRRDFFGGETFRRLDEIRAAAVRWCRDEAGVREHGTTRRRPIEHFAETDADVLLPAPTAPYDQPVWSKHTVGRDHAVVVQQALYSVPYSVQGPVRVRADSTRVKVYHRRQLVKVHPRVPRGHKQLDPADAPPGKADLVDRSATSLFDRADEQSPIIGAYARQLAPDPRRRFGDIRKVYRLLGACQTYGVEAVEEACARARELDVIDMKRIEGMLAKGLERRKVVRVPSPKKAGKVLTFERPSSDFALQKETT